MNHAMYFNYIFVLIILIIIFANMLQCSLATCLRFTVM